MVTIVNYAIFLILFVMLAASGTGCEKEEGESGPKVVKSEASQPRDNARLAARVNEVPISLDDVKEVIVASDGGMDADEALRVLIRTALLAAEAKRRGYDTSGDAQDAQRKALARAFLKKRIDEGTTSETLDQGKLREIYKAHKGRFVHGRLRRVVHFLAQSGQDKLTDKEASDLAKKAHKEARAAKDEADFMSRLAPLQKTHAGKVRIEELPPFEATDKRFVRAFVDAAFSLPKMPGLTRPVKTEFGWHVIYVVEEHPALNRSFEEAKETLSSKVLPQEKEHRAKVLLDRLVKNGDIFILEDALSAGSSKE